MKITLTEQDILKAAKALNLSPSKLIEAVRNRRTIARSMERKLMNFNEYLYLLTYTVSDYADGIVKKGELT